MPSVSASKYLVQAGWDDVPHLGEQTKKELLDATPPHLRDARSKGLPSLGAGAIYPIEESFIKVAPFELPPHFARCYGFDVGWNRTAASWMAWDRDQDVVYIYAEHYRGMVEPSIHAAAIRARGEWIPGVIDPAANGRSQKDGEQLMATYSTGLGLNIVAANNSVESGILEVWQRLEQGRLKVFSTCVSWLAEYRLYRRDERGHIIKKNDHLMDTTRYGIVSGLKRAITRPSKNIGLQEGMRTVADRIGGY